ncbi:hypothetical protein DPMN_053364 [Dreissena polymorpha]|uniref:PIH1D1/2/3 CS-like domain-containing protein n=1 Tax=Dreissena polymorpha TaxID=45954 RepID=A0A9D4CL81_DREPO|nr:hypothetical protein DPMN_053364 [Dreissena polymorpha]
MTSLSINVYASCVLPYFQKVCSSISLDLGEDRILLQTRSNTYYLDIYIPFFIVQADCGAQFNRKTRVGRGEEIVYLLLPLSTEIGNIW